MANYPRMEDTLKNKRILVTGAGQGIGRGVALRLHSLGCQVTAISRTEVHLKSLEDEAPGINTITLDVANWSETRKVVEGLPTFDGLVNNAGIAPLAPFFEATEEEFDKCYDVNVKAILNISQVVAKKMVSENIKGSIVNLSSQASKAALKNHTVYCGSKAAVDGMSRVMALELGPHGIRVNCVNPTVVLTPLSRVGWGQPSQAKPMIDKIPLGRFGEIDEVVDAIVYLLSDHSTLISGTAIPLDGGFLAT